MELATFAEVLTGWTGSVAITVGATTTTVTPLTRESVASLFARLAHDVYVDSGLALTVKPIANDQLQVSAASTFDMAYDGNCGTRCDYPYGPYAGQTVYLSDQTVVTGRIPAYGVSVEGDDLGASTGRVLASGAYAVQGVADPAHASLIVFTTFADAWDFESAVVGLYDLWVDGRLIGRYHIDAWKRTRRGKLHNQVALTADAQAVSE